MSEVEIIEVTREEDNIRRERTELKRRMMEVLQKDDAICRQHMARYGVKLVRVPEIVGLPKSLC